MRTSKKGIDLIKKYEGCSLKGYKCPAGIATIGYGHTGGVTVGIIITQADADNLLVSDLRHFELLLSGLKLPLNQNQFDACISFCFNCGFGAFKESSLFKAIKSKADNSTITHCFSLWNKGGGKILSGLVSRRKSEAELYCEL